MAEITFFYFHRVYFEKKKTAIRTTNNKESSEKNYKRFSWQEKFIRNIA